MDTTIRLQDPQLGEAIRAALAQWDDQDISKRIWEKDHDLNLEYLRLDDLHRTRCIKNQNLQILWQPDPVKRISKMANHY